MGKLLSHLQMKLLLNIEACHTLRKQRQINSVYALLHLLLVPVGIAFPLRCLVLR